MAKTMKAAVVHAFGAPLTIEEVPIPTPGPGEVLVKVIATGVCPHRPSRGERGLAGEADAAVHSGP